MRLTPWYDEYYAFCMGAEPVKSGVRWICDAGQTACGESHLISVMGCEDGITVSCSGLMGAHLPALQQAISPGMTADEVAEALRPWGRVAHSIEFQLHHVEARNGKAVVLTELDFPRYETFCRACHGSSHSLREHFEEMTAKRLICGVLDGAELVCCTDAAPASYKPERFVEMSVHTLPAYGGRGYAANACSRMLLSIVDAGLIPLWSADARNAASIALARKLGFVRYCDMISVVK